MRKLGEHAGVGLQLWSIRGALGGEKVVQAGEAVGGGLVIDDPQDVFAGGVRCGAGAEDAVDSDGDWSIGGLFLGAVNLGPGREGVFAGGIGIGCKQPEAVGIM